MVGIVGTVEGAGFGVLGVVCVLVVWVGGGAVAWVVTGVGVVTRCVVGARALGARFVAAV